MDYNELKALFALDLDSGRAAWKAADKAWDLYQGDAWRAVDQDYVRGSSDKPRITVNYIAKYINAVIGQQINTKRKIGYQPRSIDKNISADMLSNAALWFADESMLDAELNDAYKDAIVGGLGFLEIGLTFEFGEEMRPYANRINPRQMVWDKSAIKTNMRDATRAFRLSYLPLSALQSLFPDCAAAEFGFECSLDAAADSGYSDLVRQAQGVYQNSDDSRRDADSVRDMRFLLEARWIEDGEPIYIVANTWQILSERQWKAYKAENPHARAAKRRKKITRRAFLGKTDLLQPIDEPLCAEGHLGWYCMTAYRSETDKCWFGLTKNAEDPQMLLNNYTSQLVYAMRYAAKGGLIVEEGAVKDPEEFERSWASSKSISYVQAGALGRIKEKPNIDLPHGIEKMLEMAKADIPQSMGISEEFLGSPNREQANSLELTRKQSTLNILSELNENLRRLRLSIGEQIAYIIQNFVPNGVLMRVAGEEDAQYVEFSRKSVTNLKYDVIVDDIPNSVDEKNQTFIQLQALTPMVQQWMAAGAPVEFVQAVLQYSPLPAGFVKKAIETLANWQNQQQQQAQAADNAQQQAQRQAAAFKQAELQGKAEEAQGRLQLEAQKLAAEREDTQIRAQTEMAKAAAASAPAAAVR